MIVQSTPPGERITVTEASTPPENQPDAVAVYEAMVESFEAAHPNVTIESSPGGWDPQAFAARLAAGTLEDAFGDSYAEPQRLIARGQATDTTDYLRAWEHFDGFGPGVLQIVTGHDGRISGVPVFGYALGLTYSRTFFRDAGLDPDRPPATAVVALPVRGHVRETTRGARYPFSDPASRPRMKKRPSRT